MIVLASAILRKLGENVRGHVAHVLADNVGDMPSSFAFLVFQILFNYLAGVLFG